MYNVKKYALSFVKWTVTLSLYIRDRSKGIIRKFITISVGRGIQYKCFKKGRLGLDVNMVGVIKEKIVKYMG